MNNKERLAMLLLAIAVLLSAVVSIISCHLHNSLVNAVNELHVCEREGGIECHIERDRLDYNVYSW